MQEKIAIILPVIDGGLNRSKRLIRCLESYYEHTEKLSDIHVLHDKNECDIYHQIALQYPEINSHCIPVGLTLMQKINFNILEIVSKYKYTGFIGDDIIFTTPFESKIIEYLSSVKHGMAYGDDGYWNGKLPTHPFITSKTILAVGFFGCPAVEHNYFDNYWQTIFTELGTIKYIPEIVMQHHHPISGKESPDAISNNIVNKLNSDGQRFFNYISNNLSNDLNKIKSY